MKKPFLILFLMNIGVSPGLAFQSYTLVDHQKSTATISKSQLNRIAVKGDRIQQIFGADGHFQIETDDEGGQIFLNFLPQTRESSLALTLITEGGLTQDLKLIPQEIEAQTIIFTPQYETQEPVDHTPSRQDQIIKLISGMVKGGRIDGYQVQHLQETPQSDQAYPTRKYLGDEYQGIVFQMKNDGRETLVLNEQDFAQRGDLAVYLPQRYLHPGHVITFYVVQKRKDIS